MSLRYIITTGRNGVRLSLQGHWGNLPQPSVEAAEAAARQDAGHRAFAIERGRARR